MSRSRDLVPLPGSGRPPRHLAQPLEAPVDGDAAHSVSVLLRPAGEERMQEIVSDRARHLPPARGPRLDPADLAPPATALAALESFADAAGLRLGEREGRLVRLDGTLDALAAAFSVTPRLHAMAGRTVLSHDDEIRLPAALAAHTLAVLGFDRRPLATPGAAAATARTGGGSVDPRDVARAYGFPSAYDGSGQRIGLVLLGGGVREEDLEAYFRLLGMAAPSIGIEAIDPATNDPASPEALRAALEAMGLAEDAVHPAQENAKAGGGSVPWTIEATLDVELTGALAPAAALDVVFASGDIQGKVHAFSRLLTKPSGPSVISCSWGGFESAYRDQDVAAMESLFTEAAARDVALCFASGDRGDGSSTYGGPSDQPEVFYPGSSPYVVGCGGTTLDADGGGDEVSWAEPMGKSLLASGGGLSSRFDRPHWQGKELPDGSGRWVPDVAAKADLRGGYRIVAGGVEASMGGTSAASPLWGALIALCNQALAAAGHGSVGYLTPHLYPIPGGATRDITQGSNGAYAAGKGWDAVTGWGSPDGEELLRFLLGGG